MTALLCAVAVLFLACRILESPANPATTFRIVMSVLALGFVLFARRTSLVRRATVFVALEALGGFVAFAYVDVPFIVSHQAQIGAVAATVYDGINRSR